VSVAISKLANGLTVVSHGRPDVETVSLGLWVGAGSRSEDASEHGVAHFLEHMAFKGTKRRSALQIAEEIEAVGGELNAATGVDSTAYYARVLRADLELALDLLSDIILAPAFDDMELTRERDVILQEIAASFDSPEDMVFDLAQELAFPDQPLGRPILGTPKSVKAFRPAHLSTYLHSHYRAPSMVLAAAGAVEHEKLVEAAERLLQGLDAGTPALPQPANYHGGLSHSRKTFEQTHLVLAFESLPFRHPDYYAAQLCAGALGGGMSSRLFQEVREKRGLCYAIYAFASGLTDSGMFAVYAATSPDRADELLGVIHDELSRAADTGFGEDELARVRAQVKMGLLAGLESSGARAEQLARQILVYGRPLSTEELIESVEKVTLDGIQRQVQHLLQSSVSLATVGPIRKAAKFDAFAAKFVLPPSKAA
jgi:predicted Zn-dependent peptidase